MPIENLAQFQREVRNFARKLPVELLVPFQKKLVFELLTRVVNKTPVDTGTARGGWIVSINEPSEEKGSPDSDGSGTVTQGLAATAGLGPFMIAYVQNTIEYIEILEAGGSKAQAPQGMLAVSLAEMNEIFGD